MHCHAIYTQHVHLYDVVAVSDLVFAVLVRSGVASTCPSLLLFHSLFFLLARALLNEI